MDMRVEVSDSVSGLLLSLNVMIEASVYSVPSTQHPSSVSQMRMSRT